MSRGTVFIKVLLDCFMNGWIGTWKAFLSSGLFSFHTRKMHEDLINWTKKTSNWRTLNKFNLRFCLKMVFPFSFCLVVDFVLFFFLFFFYCQRKFLFPSSKRRKIRLQYIGWVGNQILCPNASSSNENEIIKLWSSEKKIILTDVQVPNIAHRIPNWN